MGILTLCKITTLTQKFPPQIISLYRNTMEQGRKKQITELQISRSQGPKQSGQS